MTVRPATTADADAVFLLLRDFATTHRPGQERFAAVTFPQVLRAAAENRAEFLVAEQETRIVGYAYAARMPTLFAGGTVLELLELAVAPSRRGRGTGSRLVRAVQARARQAGDVEVTVPTRRAADFYRRLDFTETAALLKWPTRSESPTPPPPPPESPAPAR
ncbi:GNAT family N-acetyltransferase [Streptomyces sp. NBC_00285]|uniref:GNAT family N-acetyltransferase n=1 Tax=Streptomyces sp. NBC_00285 TaxID=2975700 RepID=UPI002E2B6601|nr:GNAT family N-acetyltransferase [Streptomyces sp. NBC_00285]